MFFVSPVVNFFLPMILLLNCVTNLCDKNESFTHAVTCEKDGRSSKGKVKIKFFDALECI